MENKRKQNIGNIKTYFNVLKQISQGLEILLQNLGHRWSQDNIFTKLTLEFCKAFELKTLLKKLYIYFLSIVNFIKKIYINKGK